MTSDRKELNEKSKNKKRNFDVAKYNWYKEPLKMTSSNDIDIIVELVGGDKGLPLLK